MTHTGIYRNIKTGRYTVSITVEKNNRVYVGSAHTLEDAILIKKRFLKTGERSTIYASPDYRRRDRKKKLAFNKEEVMNKHKLIFNKYWEEKL